MHLPLLILFVLLLNLSCLLLPLPLVQFPSVHSITTLYANPAILKKFFSAHCMVLNVGTVLVVHNVGPLYRPVPQPQIIEILLNDTGNSEGTLTSDSSTVMRTFDLKRALLLPSKPKWMCSMTDFSNVVVLQIAMRLVAGFCIVLYKCDPFLML